jgi:anti-sigma regulatory factor (Ser/Thr protein kinase)
MLTTEIKKPADIAVARREATSLAAHLGFRRSDQAQLAAAVAALALDLLQDGGRASLSLRVIEGAASSSGPGIEVQAAARNPRPATIARLARDESGDDLPIGLRSASHLADQFIAVSQPDAGTMVTVRKWPH